MLFAFLVSVPLSSRFANLSGPQRGAFFVAFLATAVAIVLLVGETAYHRLVGHPYDKGRMVGTASRQAVAALALLGVALVAVVFLVTDALYRGPVGAPVAAGLFVLVVLTWFALPLRRRLRSGSGGDEG